MDLKEVLIPLCFDPRVLAVVSVVTILTATTVGSLVEYLFPPFWGDTLVLLGFVAAVHGAVPLWANFAAALAGGTAGAWAAYLLGARLGDLPWLPRRVRSSDRMERVRLWVQQRGSLALVVNRFLPGIRALFLPMAGAMHMPRARALWAATVSNVLWLLLLVGMAMATEGIPGGGPPSAGTGLALLPLLILRVPPLGGRRT